LRGIPGRWAVGWAAGAGIVGVAAGLLLEITARAHRISDQARDIAAGLDRTRDNAAPLFELKQTSSDLARITDGLRTVREADG
jgi:hypothetical protein